MKALMWSQGRERPIPKNAGTRFSCNGSYRGVSGAWMDIIHHGKCVGMVFHAGMHKQTAQRSGLQIVRDIEPFRNIAVDGAVVGGRAAKREMMRRHDLVEVGNERERIHPRDLQDQRRNRPDENIVQSLKRHSGGKWL